jgi:GT2 family glycosyltransferase
MKLSVLICTYNRPELLAQCLDALLCRTTEKPDEVVVVNGGDERSDEVVAQRAMREKQKVRGQKSEAGGQRAEGKGQKAEDRGQRIEIKLVKTVNKNLAASRNVGLPHCTGDIIAMTDDDAEVFPDWVTQMKRAHSEHPEAGGVGGLVLGRNTESLVGKVADAITFPSWREPQYVRTLPGVNISFKREAVERVGSQDEELFLSCGEDVDYNWRIQKLGYKIYFDPQIKVFHYHRPTLKAFLNQHYRYGRSYYLVRRKWPDMYCVYPRTIRRFRDVLKAGNFFAALLYEPLRTTQKASSLLRTRLSLLPMVFMAEAAWRGGMVRQAWQGDTKIRG